MNKILVTQEVKQKLGKLDVRTLKNFCIAKETYMQLKMGGTIPREHLTED